jgi:GT2 family glycosyltransferase
VRPKVSIVIVNLDRAALTLDCIESILAHTERDLCEIIVVDNGSAAAERETLTRASHRFRLVQLERNMFFGEASNIGAEQGSGDHVLFLNNDVTVTAGWLDTLLAVLGSAYRAGAVGPRIAYPDGRLQEAGGVVRPDGWSVQIGKAGMRLAPSFIEATRIVDYCSGACLLMRRSVFLDLGGFDPMFDPAYFEDVDLALRMRAIGLFTYYCGAATVHHQESVTSTRIWSAEERRQHVAANHGRLVRRWGRHLRERLRGDLEPEALPPVHWEPERAPAGRPAIAFYSPAALNADSGSELLLRAAAAFQDRCDVILASDEIQSRCRIYSLSRQLGLGLTSFKTRKLADVDQTTCSVIVTAEAGQDRPFSAPRLSLPREGWQLLQFIDRFTGSPVSAG